jgi:ADP-ribose pyrophosphatase YjhB (NUDIX family)
MTWRPNATVAAIVEQGGRFLVVEEVVCGRTVWNQPAGHLEDGESLVEAVIRETLEETGWTFEPEGLVGIYRWRQSESGITYLRFAFFGREIAHDPERRLDSDVRRCLWVTRAELAAASDRLRSPMVLRSVDDYLNGPRFPLDVLVDLVDD